MTRLPKRRWASRSSFLHGGEVLREPRGLEFRIGAAQIIAAEAGIRPYPARQEAAAQRAVSERRDLVVAAIGQDIGLDGALEQVIWRLQYVQRSNAPEPLHLGDRKIADTDGSDLLLPEQRMHRVGGFLDRHQRI